MNELTMWRADFYLVTSGWWGSGLRWGIVIHCGSINVGILKHETIKHLKIN